MKESLVIDIDEVTDEMVKKYRVKAGTKCIHYDFVLVSDKEAADLREKKAREAMEKLGMKMKYFEGLPVPDVD